MQETRQTDFSNIASAKKKRKAPAAEGKKNKRRRRSAEPKKDTKSKNSMQMAAKKNKQKPKKRQQKSKNKAKYQEIPPTKSKQLLALVWDILFYIFLFLVIGGAIFFNFNDSPDKSFFGYRFMTVLTNSMAPNPEKPELKNGFVSGDMIILQQVNPESLKEKDIITFYPVSGNTEAYLTHRVIKVMDESDGEEGLFIQTQGDANTGADIPIQGKQVVGKVIFTIPFIGNFINFVRDNLIVVTIFIAVFFGFVLTLKYYLGMNEFQKVPVKTKKRKKPSP